MCVLSFRLFPWGLCLGLFFVVEVLFCSLCVVLFCLCCGVCFVCVVVVRVVGVVGVVGCCWSGLLHRNNKTYQQHVVVGMVCLSFVIWVCFVFRDDFSLGFVLGVVFVFCWCDLVGVVCVVLRVLWGLFGLWCCSCC